MKRNIVQIVVGVLFCFVTLGVVAKEGEKKFQLLHWNILKTMYKIDELSKITKKNLSQLVADSKFKSLVTKTYTPDSYTAIFDLKTTLHVHPQGKLLGTKLSELENKEALRIVKKAIDGDQCVRGFYDFGGLEEYMIVCPLIGVTADGHKLYYSYTVRTRAIPEYYLKTLKNSVLDNE